MYQYNSIQGENHMNEKISKAEIVEEIKNRIGGDSTTIKAIVDEFMEIINESLIAGKTAELRGFGTFLVKERKGRQNARNPKTGESVEVPDRKTAVFRPGRELKEGLGK